MTAQGVAEKIVAQWADRCSPIQRAMLSLDIESAIHDEREECARLVEASHPELARQIRRRGAPRDPISRAIQATADIWW